MTATLEDVIAEIRRARPPALMSIRAAAQHLGIGRGTLRQLINERKVRVVRVGKRDKVPRAEVDRIAAEGTEQVEAPRVRWRPSVGGKNAAAQILALALPR